MGVHQTVGDCLELAFNAAVYSDTNSTGLLFVKALELIGVLRVRE